jgi:hypothetical protein
VQKLGWSPGWNRLLYTSAQIDQEVSWAAERLNTWSCLPPETVPAQSESQGLLSFLSLRENSISPEGAQALAQALCMNSTLKHLEYVVGQRGGQGRQGDCTSSGSLMPMVWTDESQALGALTISQGWRTWVGRGSEETRCSIMV